MTRDTKFVSNFYRIESGISDNFDCVSYRVIFNNPAAAAAVAVDAEAIIAGNRTAEECRSLCAMCKVIARCDIRDRQRYFWVFPSLLNRINTGFGGVPRTQE